MYARGVECELQRVNETVRANRDVDESERKILSNTIPSIHQHWAGWISISKRRGRNFCLYYNVWISIIENVLFFFLNYSLKVETLLINRCC